MILVVGGTDGCRGEEKAEGRPGAEADYIARLNSICKLRGEL